MTGIPRSGSGQQRNQLARRPALARVLEVTAPTPAQRRELAELALPSAQAESATELYFVALADTGQPIGAAMLRRTSDAEAWIGVVPAARRMGTGTALLHGVASTALRYGYSRVYCTATDATHAAAFLDWHGFRTESALNLLRLRLPAPPRAAPPPVGYRLRQWTGVPPVDMAAALLNAKRSSGDLPADGFPGARSDPAKAVRAMPNRVHKRGNILHTVAALDQQGAVVAYTELEVIAGTGRAEQGNTVVLEDHRGHALGRCLKIAMLDRIALLHPEVVEVDTENAADNGPMLSINTALGFRMVSSTSRRWAECAQLSAGCQ